jgi:hypothetical protein
LFEGDFQMKVMRKSMISLALVLFSTPILSAQDLSRYRSFSLGTSLADLSKQINETATDASVIHQSPPTIQELTFWPVPSSKSPARLEAVQELLFSFYNGELYRIVATYDKSSTQGMTVEDMVHAVSAKYGTATKRAAETNSVRTNVAYSGTGEMIALWEDSQDSLTLSRSSLSNSYQLVLYSKQLNGQAEAAIVSAVRELREDAPQREIARVKKEADDLETMRQANVKSFQP